MTGRLTAEIVAELRWASMTFGGADPTLHGEAADRLAELDADLTPMMAEEWHDLITEYNRIDALRPPCPTCGGKGFLEAVDGNGNCPDCVDGKVSIEQLAATWRAVWDDPRADATIAAWCLLDHLRAVRP